MKVICSDAKKCKNKKCPGAKPHGKAFDWKSGLTCDNIMKVCSFRPGTFVTCVPYKPKAKK